MRAANRYGALLGEIFAHRYKKGATQVPFHRVEIEKSAKRLGIELPKNLGDVIYSFRYRAELPESIRNTAPAGQEWTISPRGKSLYAFTLSRIVALKPNPALAETKVPDGTPGMILRYALTDEQALLAILRYNRLVDIFTGVTCYSLQNHLRTTVRGVGQLETDEVYVGIDKRGAQYVFPVQAKGGSEKLGPVQIGQDFAMCAHKFPALICRPIGAQFMDNDVIGLLEFVIVDGDLRIAQEKHYRLVPPADVTDEDLAAYRKLR